MKINTEGYGRHLIIDLTVKPESKSLLSDREYCAKFIDKVTEVCGMQAVIPTIAMQFPFSTEHCGLVKKLQAEGTTSPVIEEHTKYVEAKEKNDTGVSAFSIWNTSHSTLHSWTECNYISIDLYSCLVFDRDKVINFVKEYFDVAEMRVVDVMRHCKHPQTVETFTL